MNRMAEKEYIEREALMKETRSIIEFRKQHYMDTKDYDALEKYLSGIPTADVAPVVHGRWDDSGRYQFPSGAKAIRCSICGCALNESEYRLFNWNYCPVCGSKMDLEGGNT